MTTASHLLDIYGVHLDLATTRREWATLRRRLTFLSQPASAGMAEWALWEPKGKGATVPHLAFWIDPTAHDTDLDLLNTCAHEAAHGANHILGWIEHDVSGSNEPHAYLVGWLTAWLWKAVAG